MAACFNGLYLLWPLARVTTYIAQWISALDAAGKLQWDNGPFLLSLSAVMNPDPSAFILGVGLLEGLINKFIN